MTDNSMKGWQVASDIGYTCHQTQYLRDAIVKVTRQKQRPTAARIFKAVRQCVESATIEQVTVWLQSAVHSGDLVMVDNDGIVSYREPRRNASAVVPAVQHMPETQNWSVGSCSDLSRHYASSYEQYRDVSVPYPSNAANWHCSSVQPTFETEIPFRSECRPQPSDLWSKSYSAAVSGTDSARTFANENVRMYSHRSVQQPHEYVSSYAQINCDENRNQHVNDAVLRGLSNSNFLKADCNYAERPRTDFSVASDIQRECSDLNYQRSSSWTASIPSGGSHQDHVFSSPAHQLKNSFFSSKVHSLPNYAHAAHGQETFECSQLTSSVAPTAGRQLIVSNDCCVQRSTCEAFHSKILTAVQDDHLLLDSSSQEDGEKWATPVQARESQKNFYAEVKKARVNSDGLLPGECASNALCESSTSEPLGEKEAEQKTLLPCGYSEVEVKTRPTAGTHTFIKNELCDTVQDSLLKTGPDAKVPINSEMVTADIGNAITSSSVVHDKLQDVCPELAAACHYREQDVSNNITEVPCEDASSRNDEKYDVSTRELHCGTQEGQQGYHEERCEDDFKSVNSCNNSVVEENQFHEVSIKKLSFFSLSVAQWGQY